MWCTLTLLLSAAVLAAAAAINARSNANLRETERNYDATEKLLAEIRFGHRQ